MLWSDSCEKGDVMIVDVAVFLVIAVKGNFTFVPEIHWFYFKLIIYVLIDVLI